MTVTQALVAVAAAIAMITTGLVVMFGPWALVGSGVFVLVLTATIVDIKPKKEVTRDG